MFTLLKGGLLLMYAAAILSPWLPLPDGAAARLQTLALVIVGVHVLEALFVLRILRRHPGGMAQSVLLCLLFGLFHWRPLAARPEA